MNKAVYLPNGNIIRTTKRTSLPFRQLSNRAREAHVLPQLRQSLMSVNKLSEEGYTTIFHPENEGVTVHEKGTLTIATSSPPVLQGCKEKGDNLWTVSANEEEGEEKAINVYNLPSTKQSIPSLRISFCHRLCNRNPHVYYFHVSYCDQSGIAFSLQFVSRQLRTECQRSCLIRI